MEARSTAASWSICMPPSFSTTAPPPCCCRHWFFKADLFVDGEKMPENLMDIVKSTLTANKGNSVIGFKDNSSAIRGGPVTPMLPTTPGSSSKLEPQASKAAWASVVA